MYSVAKLHRAAFASISAPARLLQVRGNSGTTPTPGAISLNLKKLYITGLKLKKEKGCHGDYRPIHT